jgi:hypothetical protein
MELMAQVISKQKPIKKKKKEDVTDGVSICCPMLLDMVGRILNK